MVITTIVRIIGIIISFMLINIIIKKSNIKNKRKMSIFLGIYFIVLHLKCSIFEVIRIIPFIILLTLLYFKIKKSKIINKRRAYLLAIICCALLQTFSHLIIIENYFFTFETFEKAYIYYKGPNMKKLTVIVGDNSAFTINKKDETKIFRKRNGGYILPVSHKLKSYSYEIYTNSLPFVHLYNHSKKDNYIKIEGFNQKTEISDNLNSNFVEVKRRNINGYYYNYYAYLKEFNEDYRLIINGEEKKLSPF